jgi:hypothetical protein
MKIYTYSTSHYGSGVCVANSKEDAIKIFTQNHINGNGFLLDMDDDGIQEFEIEHGFCHIDLGDL